MHQVSQHGTRSLCFGLCCLLAAAGAATAANEQPGGPASRVDAAQQRPALKVRNASKAVMLGAAHAGQRIVTVGERGLILLSDDGGKSWQQAAVPTSVTLTAVRFADRHLGVAVGHAGVALLTRDGGKHWERILDGQKLAALAFDAASRSGDPALLRDAQHLQEDGPDKPLLDVALLGNGRILVVGAYGLIYGSDDLGRTWQPWMERTSNPKGLHLNTVRNLGDTVLIGGERGIALISQDGGRSFRNLTLPYQGSYFTAELRSAQEMVLAGLRGNAWQSSDGGQTWAQLAAPAPVTITGSTTMSDGTLLFSNQAGMLMAMQGPRLVPKSIPALPPVNTVLGLGNGAALALTIQGLMPVPASAAGVSK